MAKIEVNINGIPVPGKKKNKEQELLGKLRDRRKNFEAGQYTPPCKHKECCDNKKPLADIVDGVIKFKSEEAHKREVEEAKKDILAAKPVMEKLIPTKANKEFWGLMPQDFVERAQKVSDEYNKLCQDVKEFSKTHKKFPKFILEGVLLNKFPEETELPWEEKTHKEICDSLHETYKKKNADYGNSFTKLYEKLGMTAAQVFIDIKYNRFQELLDKDPEVVGESIDDTLLDLANYCILTLVERKRGK